MRTLPSALVVASGLLLATACGGEPTSTIPAAVADDLAARAEALAAGLEADDPCGALGTAGELVRVTAEHRDAGEVPPDIAGEVISTTRDTVRGVTCVPEPAPEPAPPTPEDEGRGEKDDREDEGKGGGKDDDPRWGEHDKDEDGEGRRKGKDKDEDGGDD